MFLWNSFVVVRAVGSYILPAARFIVTNVNYVFKVNH